VIASLHVYIPEPISESRLKLMAADR